MPEGIAYVGANVIAGAGKELNYLGNHVYAYSGEVSVDDNETTLLSTTSGAGIIISKFYFPRLEVTAVSDDYLWTVKFNGVVIYRTQTTSSFQVPLRVGVKLIIPPYTAVTVTGLNITDDSANNIGAIIVGKVFK